MGAKRSEGRRRPGEESPDAASMPKGRRPGAAARRGRHRCLGRRAGRLPEVLRRGCPPDCGLAFVLVPHLDPTHESLMADLLAGHTAMPVVRGRGPDMAVEPGRVYVLPPNKYMTIGGRVLHLTGPVERRGLRMPDRSLSSAPWPRTGRNGPIGIILSGTGIDGTLGSESDQGQRRHGRWCRTRDGASTTACPAARSPPDVVDYILPPEQMPQALIRYVRALTRASDRAAETPVGEGPRPRPGILALAPAPRAELDFGCYKKATLAPPHPAAHGPAPDRPDRRIPRLLCADDPTEVDGSVKDLLIGVTSFFRDREAFAGARKRRGDPPTGPDEEGGERRAGLGARAAPRARRPTPSPCC